MYIVHISGRKNLSCRFVDFLILDNQYCLSGLLLFGVEEDVVDTLLCVRFSFFDDELVAFSISVEDVVASTTFFVLPSFRYINILSCVSCVMCRVLNI